MDRPWSPYAIHLFPINLENDLEEELVLLQETEEYYKELNYIYSIVNPQNRDEDKNASNL